MLDIPFCRKVLEFAEIEHSDFKHRQAVFFAKHDADAATQESWEEFEYAHPCGTVGCLAGIACMLSGELNTVALHRNGLVIMDVAEPYWVDVGARIMGLTSAQADDLFWEMDEAVALARLRSYIKEAEKEQMGDTQ